MALSVPFVLSKEPCTKADENGGVLLSLQMLYEGQCKYASKIKRILKRGTSTASVRSTASDHSFILPGVLEAVVVIKIITPIWHQHLQAAELFDIVLNTACRYVYVIQILICPRMNFECTFIVHVAQWMSCACLLG